MVAVLIAHELFRDLAGEPTWYQANLSASGVRFISEALEHLDPDDLFTIKWKEFEERCKDDHWKES